MTGTVRQVPETATQIVGRFIGIARAGGGFAAFCAPGAFARHGKVPGAADSVDARYVTRLFGARDIVIGATTVVGPTRRAALWIGVVCDCLDTASGILAAREGKDAQWVRSASAVTGLFAAAGLFAGLCAAPTPSTPALSDSARPDCG